MSRVAKLHMRIMYVVNSTWPNIFSVGTCVWRRRPTLAEPLNPGSAQHVWRWWDARVQHFHHKLFGQWWRLDATFRTIDRYTVLLKLGGGYMDELCWSSISQMWKITLIIFTETPLHQPSIQSQGDDSTVDPQGLPRNLQQTTGTHLGQVIDNNKNVQCAVITFLCPTRTKKGTFGCFLAHILNYLNSSIPRFLMLPDY